MNSWKGQFKDYTTNLAFRLSLSKEMVYTMELIRDSYHNGGWAVVRLLELAELIKPAQVKEGTNG